MKKGTMSDILFDCPHCKGQLTVDEAGAGRSVKCPLCDQSICIPELNNSRGQAEPPELPNVKVEPPDLPNKNKKMPSDIQELRHMAEFGEPQRRKAAQLLVEMHERAARDPSASAKLFRKAAEKGDASAQYKLGQSYYKGADVPQDFTEAAKWFRKAAEQGDANGQFWLGMSCADGLGIPKDFAEAYKWINIAAKATGDGSMISMCDEIKRHMTPEQVEDGEKRIAELIPSQSITVAHDEPVQYLITPENVREFVEMAQKGDTNVMCQLGNYFEEFAVREGADADPRDFVESAKWYFMAANMGVATAQLKLGLNSLHGRGMPTNAFEAYKWIALAARGGADSAAGFLEAFEENMTQEQIAEGQRRIADFLLSQCENNAGITPKSDGAVDTTDFDLENEKTDQKTSKKKNIKRPRIPCPFCGEMILEVAIKCKHCGSDLTENIAAKKTLGTNTAPRAQEDIVQSGSNKEVRLQPPRADSLPAGSEMSEDETAAHRRAEFAKKGRDVGLKILKGLWQAGKDISNAQKTVHM